MICYEIEQNKNIVKELGYSGGSLISKKFND